jgi:hypothetical protein
MGKHTGGFGLRKSRRNPTKAQRRAAKLFTPPPGAVARDVVQWFSSGGCPNAAIEEMTNKSHGFVHKWTHRKDSRTRPGRGPKPVIPDDALPVLEKAVVKKRFASANKLRGLAVNPQTGKMVSRSTMCRALDRAGLASVKVKRCPKLTAIQKVNRLAFCKKTQRKCEGWQRNWMWSDEKWFEIGGVQGNEHMWVEKEDPDPDERYVGKAAHPTKVVSLPVPLAVPLTAVLTALPLPLMTADPLATSLPLCCSHSLQVHVWAAICHSGRSALHIHVGSINSEVYIECVEEALLPSLYEKKWLGLNKRIKYVFQYDGASCHKSKLTLGWLRKHLPKHITALKKGEWPANSPDLSPIETLWNIL